MYVLVGLARSLRGRYGIACSRRHAQSHRVQISDFSAKIRWLRGVPLVSTANLRLCNNMHLGAWQTRICVREMLFSHSSDRFFIACTIS